MGIEYAVIGGTIGTFAGGVTKYMQDMMRDGGDAFHGNTRMACIAGGLCGGGTTAPVMYMYGFHKGYRGHKSVNGDEEEL